MVHRKKEQVYHKTPLKKHIRNIFFMILGSILVCIGFTMFVTPNGLLSGGVWGVSAIISHFVPQVPFAAYLIILNIPLIIWGWNELRLRFAIYTIFVIFLQSSMLAAFELYITPYTNNPLLASIFGGCLIGAGAGIIVKYRGSGGGTDIVGIILKNRYDISVGTVSLISNAIIVGCAATIFGFEPAMYTMVQLFTVSQVFTKVLEGFNHKRNMMIITENGQEIADNLMSSLGRGVTITKGAGAFTGREKDILFCVVSRFELAPLKEIISNIDPHAFVCINETYEVMGSFNKKVDARQIAKSKAAIEEHHAIDLHCLAEPGISVTDCLDAVGKNINDTKEQNTDE